MEFKIGEIYYGFKCSEYENIEDIKSRGYIFKHEKSGAELMVLNNSDENKAFALCFRTPVTDSTGVPHILEHSVLNGSRKFKIKDPFAEMLKTSLASFINAFTFPDKTMYPVASKNEKDLLNLMDIYLDSVFFPLLTKETFLQEGWHYDIKSREDSLKYKGVVYNEMKGVFSSPDSVADKLRNRVLLSETSYKYVSGGAPEEIPSLTYEAFKEYHKKYYHPSNCKMIIYGNCNVEKYLEFIDSGYLSKFDEIDVKSEIGIQKRYDSIEDIVGTYPVSKEESLENKCYILKSYLLDEVKDRKKDLSFSILSTILSELDSSPLRRAVIESGIGEAMYGGEYNNYIREGVYDIGVRGCNLGADNSAVKKFNEIIEKKLLELSENGIDKKLVTAAINRNEFILREANFGDFPKGIVYFIEAMRSWLYNGHPFDSLRFEKILEEIKQEAEQGYFENLLKKYFLSNGHKVTIALKPDNRLEEEQNKREEKKLSEIKSGFNDIEVENIIKESMKLEELQMTPNSKESLDSLPKLALSDIEIEPVLYPTEKLNIDGVPLLFHNINSNGIVYFTIAFDFSDIDEKTLPFISILASLFKFLGSKNRSSEEIEQEINSYTGGIELLKYITEHSKNGNSVNRLMVSGKSSVTGFEKLQSIILELCMTLNCRNSVKIREILLKKLNEMRNSILSSGHATVISRMGYHLSEAGKRQEIMNGIVYYRFLEEVLKLLDSDPEKLFQLIEQIRENVFSKDRAVMNITCSSENFEKIGGSLNRFAACLKKNEVKDRIESPIELETPQKNEALVAATQVQYVGLGFNLKNAGYNKSGKIYVAKKIIDIDYLWQNVRLKGGAYGGFSSYDSMSQEWRFASYRDPNLSESLDIYKKCAEFLKGFKIEKSELEKSIIGAFQPMEKPVLPDRAGLREFYRYLTGITIEDLRTEREQIISTTVDDINSLGEVFERGAVEAVSAVIGNKEKVEKSRELFKEVKNLFEK